MSLPLNVFKSLPFDVPAVGTEIYQVPLGYNCIVLMAQVTNTDALTQTFTLSLQRDGVSTPVAYDYEVPSKEIFSVSGGSSGKLVLQTGDKLILSGSSTNLKFILSLLETLK
jgi:hypothetical protein